jgi:hypothetical protein
MAIIVHVGVVARYGNIFPSQGMIEKAVGIPAAQTPYSLR